MSRKPIKSSVSTLDTRFDVADYTGYNDSIELSDLFPSHFLPLKYVYASFYECHSTVYAAFITSSFIIYWNQVSMTRTMFNAKTITKHKP